MLLAFCWVGVGGEVLDWGFRLGRGGGYGLVE